MTIENARTEDSHDLVLVRTLDAPRDKVWPSARAFLTAGISFEDAGGGRTRYTARAMHWSAEDREEHEGMGFYESWGKTADQLEALARTL